MPRWFYSQIQGRKLLKIGSGLPVSLKETLIYRDALSSAVDGSGACWKEPAGCGGPKFSSQVLYSSLAVSFLPRKEMVKSWRTFWVLFMEGKHLVLYKCFPDGLS